MAEPRRLGDPPDWRCRSGADWPWLQATRRQAFERFRMSGIPDTGVEAWKYTPLGDLAERGFSFVDRASSGTADPECVDPERTDVESPDRDRGSWPAGHRLLFRDGRWCKQGSHLLPLPPGARLMPLREAIERRLPELESALGQVVRLDDQPFAALNAARFDDGVLLYLPRGCMLEQPIYCRFETRAEAEPAASFPRLLVLMEPGSQARLLEEHVGTGSDALTDLLAEIRLGDDARLFHGRLFAAELNDRRISGIHVRQARGSRYHNYTLTLGGALGRNDLRVGLEGEGAEVLLDGLYLLDELQHLDNHLRVDHHRPGGRSDQFYKGILGGRARAVFNGLAVVHPDAQRSDARQINRNLLLSAGAEVDTKPELQIEADDVKCSHGATVGCLDREQLFYLRSRGIDHDSAQALLTFAFARETLQRLPRDLRRGYEALLTAALSERYGARLDPSWLNQDPAPAGEEAVDDRSR